MSSRPAILIVVPTQQRVRNILQTELFSRLRANGHPIRIVSPFSSEEGFRRKFAGPSTTFETLTDPDRVALFLISLRMDALRFRNPVLLDGWRIKRQMTRKLAPSPFRTATTAFFRNAILACIPSAFRTSTRFWDALMRQTISARRARKTVQRYRPGIILTSTAGMEGCEKLFLLAGADAKIPVIALDENIDAPDYRYFSPPWGDAHYACFGEPERQEFRELQSIPLDHLHLTGALRYDRYFSKPAHEPRDAFMKERGLDPRQPYIVFATTDPLKFPYNEDIITLLMRAMADGSLDSAQLYVRFDAHDDLSSYAPSFLKSFFWERAEERDDPDYLVNLLHHASAVVGVGVTTLTIEAIAAGTPAVWAAFDGFAHPPSHESVVAQYRLPFVHRIVQTGGVRMAQSPEELVAILEESVTSREQGMTARNLLLHAEYANSKGVTASERIMQLIDVLTSRTPVRTERN